MDAHNDEEQIIKAGGKSSRVVVTCEPIHNTIAYPQLVALKDLRNLDG